jgi:hypothetical protein
MLLVRRETADPLRLYLRFVPFVYVQRADQRIDRHDTAVDLIPGLAQPGCHRGDRLPISHGAADD